MVMIKIIEDAPARIKGFSMKDFISSDEDFSKEDFFDLMADTWDRIDTIHVELKDLSSKIERLLRRK